MSRKWFILVAVGIVLVASPWAWAAESSEANTAFQNELSNGPVGRFQAVPMDDSTVVILDTREGHIWTWNVSGLGTVSMVYGGQVFRGENMGEMIQSVPPKGNKK